MAPGSTAVGSCVCCDVGILFPIATRRDNTFYNGAAICEVAAEIVCSLDLWSVDRTVVSAVPFNGTADCTIFVISDCECVTACDDPGTEDEVLAPREDPT